MVAPRGRAAWKHLEAELVATGGSAWKQTDWRQCREAALPGSTWKQSWKRLEAVLRLPLPRGCAWRQCHEAVLPLPGGSAGRQNCLVAAPGGSAAWKHLEAELEAIGGRAWRQYCLEAAPGCRVAWKQISLSAEGSAWRQYCREAAPRGSAAWKQCWDSSSRQRLEATAGRQRLKAELPGSSSGVPDGSTGGAKLPGGSAERQSCLEVDLG